MKATTLLIQTITIEERTSGRNHFENADRRGNNKHRYDDKEKQLNETVRRRLKKRNLLHGDSARVQQKDRKVPLISSILTP